jgi:hypothetical protein
VSTRYRTFTFSQARLTVLSVLVMVVGALLGFLYAGHFVTDQRNVISQMKGSLVHAQRENERLLTMLSEQKVALAMHEANEAITLEQMQQMVSERQMLQQQISQYQQVLNSGEKDGYLAIQKASVTSLSEDNVVLLTLLLVQGRAIKSTIYGQLDMTLEGIKAGKTVEYDLADLLTTSSVFVEDNSSLSYKYQYFLERFYVLAIPEGFTPIKLSISSNVMQWKRKRETFNQTYAWQDLVS